MEIRLWREILDPYYLAVDELLVKFNHMIKECREAGEYSPIEQVTGRVKKISSILEKAQKKKINLEDVEERMNDIAGIRIICQFVEDIDRVVEIIQQRSDMEVINIKDYVENRKESGYRSLHINIYYNVETMHAKKRVQVEIQIRTLAMNFWATIEHSLQYKYKGNMPAHISERLQNASEAILKLDEEMSVIRDEIIGAQNSFNIKAGIVADVLNNIQNLYKVANKREVVKIQDEFYRVYETEDLDMLIKFHKELDLIVQHYRAQDL